MRLRPVEPKDAAAIDAINALIPEGEYLSLSVKDRNDAADMISRLTPFDHMFVFETEDETPEICAIVLLRVNHQIYLRRTSYLRVIVAPKHQGKGFGKILIDAALKFANDELMMERVEVESPTDNIAALKLCNSAGLKVEGIAKDWLRTSDGRYVDAYLMARCRSV